jgi:hypothetical protein
MENLNDSKDINGLGKTLNRTTKPQLKSLGLYELKQHKPWFEEKCSQFLNQRNKAKME